MAEIVLVDARALSTRSISEDPARRPFVMYLAKIKACSKRAVTTRLRLIARLTGYPDTASLERFPWEHLQPAHVATLSTQLCLQYAPDTVRATIVALRGILRACWHCGLYAWEDYERRADAITRPAGERLPKGRALTPEECKRLYDFAGLRDRALLALLFGAGLRRSEAAAIDWSAFDGAALRFRGKGDKERLVPVPAWACAALRAVRPSNGTGRILRARLGRRGGFGEAMSAEGIYHALRALADRAKVASVAPHDARRTYISELLDVADLATTAALVGHSSTEQTRRYDRRGDRAARDAVDRLRPIATAIERGEHLKGGE